MTVPYTFANQTGPIPLSELDTNFVSVEAALAAHESDTSTHGVVGSIVGTGQSNTFSQSQVINTTDNTNAALRVTQLGTGNSLLVEDTANPDSTPFTIDNAGRVISGATVAQSTEIATLVVTPQVQTIGTTSLSNNAFGQFAYEATNSNIFPYHTFARSRSATVGNHTLVSASDGLGGISWAGSDGTQFCEAARIRVIVDGTPGTDSMPGLMSLQTTPAGSATPVERMRIRSDGKFGFNGVGSAAVTMYLQGDITGGVNAYGLDSNLVIRSDVTGSATNFFSLSNTEAVSFNCGIVNHFYAVQTFIGAGSSVTSQYAFRVASTLTSATNNYGFYGDIDAGAGRWNLYMGGTAANYIAGDVQLGKTVTPAGTTGARTINNTIGSVNFAAAAASLVVTNSLVTVNSIITATVGTNDTTMKSVAVVAAAGSFTLYANAAATAETRVNFHVFN